MIKPCIGITGSSRGLGKALETSLSSRYPTKKIISRIEHPEKVVAELLDVDVFINNAYDAFHQCVLFQTVYEHWRCDPSKYIINIGSRASEPNISKGAMYSASKATLMHLTKLAIFNDEYKKCRISLVNLGLIESDISSVNYSEVSGLIEYLINLQPRLEIPIVYFQHSMSYKIVQAQKSKLQEDTTNECKT